MIVILMFDSDTDWVDSNINQIEIGFPITNTISKVIVLLLVLVLVKY